MLNFRHRQFLCLLCLLSCFAGCSFLKASPADNAGFLPKPDLLKESRDRAPFNAYWVFDGEGYEKIRLKYKKVYIAPVDTSVVQAIYLAASGSDENKMMRIEEAQQLAKYFRERLKLNISNVKDSTIDVVDSPGMGVLSIRLALVQVVPANPGVNFIGTVAGFFVPGGGLIKIAGEGSVAMEGYIDEVDSSSNLYEQFKDREGQKTSPFSLKDYQRYAHIRERIDEWAQQLTLMLVTPSQYQVEDADLITLNPL